MLTLGQPSVPMLWNCRIVLSLSLTIQLVVHCRSACSSASRSSIVSMKCHHFRSLYDIVADGHRLRLRHSTITTNRYQLRSSCTDSTYSEKRDKREPIADHRGIDKWVLQFDGGSRGNPGLGGSGAVLLALNASSGILTEVWNCYNFLGEKKITNNVAEYNGLLFGVKGIVKLNIQSVEIQGDSLLVIRQLQGQYQVKSESLKPFFKRAMALLKKIRWKTFKHIPRELNARADYLSNQAMDSKKSKTTLLHAKLIQFNQTVVEPSSASPIALVEAAQSDSSVSPTASSDAATDNSFQQQLNHHLELIQQLKTQSEYHSDMLSESSIMMTSLDSRVTTLQQSLTAKVKKPRKSKSTN